MGNCISQKTPVFEKTCTKPMQTKPLLCLAKQGISTKYLLYKSIQNQDIETTKKLHYFFSVDPNEEVSIQGYYWTALHYAAFFGSVMHLEYFLKLIYLKQKEHLTEILNLPTVENYTPLMIAAMNGKRVVLELLLKIGGVKLDVKDTKGRTAIDLAKSNGKSNCAEFLEKFMNSKSSSMKLNIDYFKNAEAVLNYTPYNKPVDEKEDEDDPKNLELITKGKRIPCVICQEDTGLIKYTRCCGQPLHSFCVEDKIKNCPYCKCGNLELINEIYHPQRAFEL